MTNTLSILTLLNLAGELIFKAIIMGRRTEVPIRKLITKIQKKLKSNLGDLSKTAAYFSEENEVGNDKYRLKNKELISVIPPIGGG